MGTAYLAHDKRGRVAVLKVVRSDLAGDPLFRVRFAREVEALRAVQGEGVARILGADPFAPQPWLATEFIPGPTLARQVTEVGPLPDAHLRPFAVALLRALHQIHGHGVVHRDLKPEVHSLHYISCLHFNQL